MPAFFISFYYYVISCRLFSSEQAAFFTSQKIILTFFQKHPPNRPLPLGISEGVLPKAEEGTSLFLEN